MSVEGKPNKNQRQIAMVLIAVGGLLCVGSIGFLLFDLVQQSGLQSTTGTVDRVKTWRERRYDSEEITRKRMVTVRRYVVQYQVNSATYELEMETFPERELGDSVPVLYSPEKPADGIINTTAERWGLKIIFGSFGLFFFLGGLLVFPWPVPETRSMFVWSEDAPVLGFVLVGLGIGGPLSFLLLSGSGSKGFPVNIFSGIGLIVLIGFPWAGFYLFYRQVRARWCFACRRPREKWNDYWYQCPQCGAGRWFEIPDGDKSKYQRRRSHRE